MPTNVAYVASAIRTRSLFFSESSILKNIYLEKKWYLEKNDCFLWLKALKKTVQFLSVPSIDSDRKSSTVQAQLLLGEVLVNSFLVFAARRSNKGRRVS